MMVLWAAIGCSSGKQAAGTNPDGGGAGGTGMPPPPPFAPVQPASYVAKVKNVLLGLPATDAEVQQVVADPSSFKTMVTGWMQQPEYTDKMRRFFELAFQQTQVTAVDFADQFYPKQIDINGTTTPLLVQNEQESFARTMLQLIADGHPLSEATTTNQLMMTTALKEMYAFLDVWEVDDAGKVTDRFKQANPNLMITVEASQGSILIQDTLDATNTTTYMHWYDPDITTANMTIAGCNMDPLVYPASAVTLHYLLYGALDGHKNATAGGVNCPPVGGTAAAPQLSAATDFSDWQMVTIRPPAMGEAVTNFYDLPKLRTATELVLSVPRVGFFSTPAFFANWQTNISNQMRVTMNQTLIVALGAQVDGTDTTSVPGNPPPGLDTAHAGAGACFSCHQTLDPLRSILASSWSWNYHDQLEAAFAGQKGLFAFHGVITPVSSIGDMGQALGQHPLFAPAWVQKLCTYVNSAPCVDSDPELQRVVGVFEGSNMSWNALVAELVTSPLVTNATETLTAQTNGEVIAVARRDHLCAALNNRLGLTDVCGLDAVTKKQAAMIVPQIAAGLPSDGYGRGATMPVLPNAPTLFYRAGTENICETVAAQVIDVASAKQVMGQRYWSSTAPDAAIADFVSTVMGLVASDPRTAQATSLLSGHYAAAMQQGATASDALKSTFVTACLAPSAVSIGL
jgi:hypothetical protein